MSVKVNILEDGKGVEIIASGVVTGSEILAIQRERYNEARFQKQRYQIIDKSQCTEYNVTYKDIDMISKYDREAAEVNQNIIIAIIESESLQFSLTQLWQTHIHDCALLTKSFKNRDNALKWIEKNLKPH